MNWCYPCPREGVRMLSTLVPTRRTDTVNERGTGPFNPVNLRHGDKETDILSLTLQEDPFDPCNLLYRVIS